MIKHTHIKLLSLINRKLHTAKLLFIFMLILCPHINCSENYYDLLLDENITPEIPAFIIKQEILLSDFEIDSGDNERDQTLFFITDSGDIHPGIEPDQRGMFYSEKSGNCSSCEVIPLAGLINKSQTGEYGTTITAENNNRFSHIETQLSRNCAETGWCQTMLGFSFFIHKPDTLGQKINEHRNADLTETKGISFTIKGTLNSANLYLVMVSTNIMDWSHWQVKITGQVSNSWQRIKMTWPDFSNPGWGEGMNINDIGENLRCVEGFKFVLKNKSSDSIISSDLSIDDIVITVD